MERIPDPQAASLSSDLARGIAATLGNLGVVTHQCGDLGRARDYYEESLQGFRTLGDQRGIANTLGNLGVVAEEL